MRHGAVDRSLGFQAQARPGLSGVVSPVLMSVVARLELFAPDVADHYKLVVTEVLTIALICPAVEEFLPRDLIEVFIRVVDDDGQLDMLCHISSLFDFRESVLRDPGLRLQP